MEEIKKHKVVIVLNGVVALGPPLPSSNTTPITAKGPLFGVMPLSGRRPVTLPEETREQTSREKTSREKSERFSPVHVPVIFTKLESLAGVGRPPDDRFRGFGIWYPIRERMEVAIDGRTTPGDLVYVHSPDYGKPGKPGDPKGPLKAPITDFAAVPDMRYVSPGCSVLRKGVLAPKTGDVAAQIFVPFGELSGGAHDDRKFGHPVVYRSARGKSDVSVVVPQVRLTVEVAREITIHTWSLDTGEKLDPLSFEVTRDAELWITNIEPNDVQAIIKDLDISGKAYAVVQSIIDHLAGFAATAESSEKPDSCDVDFARIYEVTEPNGEVVLPCDADGERGERKCYPATVGSSEDIYLLSGGDNKAHE
jgi:hypothetical protein